MLKLSTMKTELLGEEFLLEVEWEDKGEGIWIATATLMQRSDYDPSGVYLKSGYWTRLDISKILTPDMEAKIVDAITQEHRFLYAA